MLPINPERSSESLRQIQLQSKIDELNNLESWGSWDVALVSDREIQGVIEETLKSLQLCPNESLNSSLLDLTDRVRLDEHTGLELRILAIKVQDSLKGEIPIFPTVLAIKVQDSLKDEIPIFPITEDSTTHVLEKMKMKDLSRLSRVSHYGNKIGKEAIITRIKKLGFNGESYEEAIKYLKGFEGELLNLKQNFYRNEDEELPSLMKILNARFDEPSNNQNKVEFEGEESKIERIIDVLERFKDLSSTDLMAFFFNRSFEGCKQLRKLLFSHFDKVSLEVNNSAQEMQALALLSTVFNRDIEALKFLLRLGVPTELKYQDKTALQRVAGWKIKSADDSEVIELLTNAQGWGHLSSDRIGNEAIIDRIQNVGFYGASYEKAIEYLKGFEEELHNLQQTFYRRSSEDEELPSLMKILNEKFNEPPNNRSKVKSTGEELKIERITDVLERFKDLSSTELMAFFFNESFRECEKLRKFLFSHFEKVSLEVDDSAKEMQARALLLAAASYDIEALEFLLGLGVSPDLKFQGKTILEKAKGWGNRFTGVVELLTEAQRKPE